MIICIKCTPEIKSKMDKMLVKGNERDYRDYSEVVAVAIDNLWLLEQEYAEKGAGIIDGDSSSFVFFEGDKSKEKVNDQSSSGGAPVSRAAEPVHIPDLFALENLDSLHVPTAEISPGSKSGDEYPEGIPLDKCAHQIGEAAAFLGDYLADHDRRHNIPRDACLSTAFPHTGSDAEKGRSRYANHFIGSVNTKGILSGILWDYRLIGPVSGDGICLLPTEPAIHFARMKNPALDNGQSDPVQKFSAGEVDFLLKHIHAHVPVEEFAFKAILQAVAEGAATPDKLDEALRVHVPSETDRSLSASFLASQRSGALSRMSDLGLIGRERKGIRVSYKIMLKGEAFLRNEIGYQEETDQ